MSGSIGGYFPGLQGGRGSVLQVWIEVTPSGVYNLQVGAGGQGATSTAPATAGQATTFSGPGGSFYSAAGGPALGGVGNSTPTPIWTISPGLYDYGLGGTGGSAFPTVTNGGNGGNGLIVIEWID